MTVSHAGAMRPACFILFILAITAPPAAADPQKLAPNVWLVPGTFAPGRQPDGNSVVWQGPDGLTVLDTGRHAAQTDQIIALAERLGAPVTTIINSHWHLDHVSGNPRLKARWPAAKVYASDAIGAALTGFLAKSAQSSRALLDQPGLAPQTREDIQLDLATIAAGDTLRPDMAVNQSRDLMLGKKRLRLNLARGATAGDVWIQDPDNRLVATGDLVTLPAPFLDTADPERWSRALDAIAATNFRLLVPGHGGVMTRADFLRYRAAFNDFRGCAASNAPDAVCADAWLAALAALIPSGEQDRAKKLLAYYVKLLRAPIR